MLYGESENDPGNGGNVLIVGGQGEDTLWGNSGNDILFGDETDTDLNSPSAASPDSSSSSATDGQNGYSGTVDTFINPGAPNVDKSSSTHLNIDGNGNGTNGIQGLIQFEDIFGTQTGQIALDASITSAVLEFDVSNSGDSLRLHAMLQSWSDTVTWNALGNGIQANGSDAATTPIAITGDVGTGLLSIDVMASLQTWQADPSTNHGWALLPTGTDGVNLDSSEGAIARLR